MSKKSQEHPYIPALNGEVLRTKHDKFYSNGLMTLRPSIHSKSEILRVARVLLYSIHVAAIGVI